MATTTMKLGLHKPAQSDHPNSSAADLATDMQTIDDALDTDGTLAANSDTKIASQKATKTYADGKVADAIDDGTTTVAPSQNAVFDALALKAPLASPALTGDPTAPTPAAGDIDTSIATSAFVEARIVAALGLLTTGQETIPRALVTTAFGLSNQNFRFGCFTARKSETTTQLTVACSAGYSGGTPTVIRFGLYSIDGSGNLTLIASTANDTTLLAAAQDYTKAWSASVALTAGTRYAFGGLVVTGGTGPSIAGFSNSSMATQFGLSPRLAGLVGSQSDLPSSVLVGSITNAAIAPYAAILP